jgi:hypothetical protein
LKRVLALAALFGACSLDTGVFAGKSCDTLLDCPPPYTCVEARPGTCLNPGPGGRCRSCELVPAITLGSSLGPVSYYCSGTDAGDDVHGVVERVCQSVCHGADMEYPNVPKTFRLDHYLKSSPGCGGTCLGAFDERRDMKSQVDIGAMPPPDDGTGAIQQATPNDKLIISQWVGAGGPLAPMGVTVDDQCNPSGSSPPPDAGSADAG